MSEPDINDIFDSIACSEETSNEQGYEEGIQKGLHDGEIDGFHLGYHKGAQIGAELGFYNGNNNNVYLLKTACGCDLCDSCACRQCRRIPGFRPCHKPYLFDVIMDVLY